MEKKFVYVEMSADTLRTTESKIMTKCMTRNALKQSLESYGVSEAETDRVLNEFDTKDWTTSWLDFYEPQMAKLIHVSCPNVQ